MNIFYLHENPKQAASMMCDKHVVKMILESAQMLCTAHRVNDGVMSVITKNNHKQKIYVHPNRKMNELLYKATHINHPSAVWVRKNKYHYLWLYEHMLQLNAEYRVRYLHDYDHLTITKLSKLLSEPPKNIDSDPHGWCSPPICMDDQYKVNDDVIASYRNYYLLAKRKFATWKLPEKVPTWWHKQRG